jgi:hypothetical protein
MGVLTDELISWENPTHLGRATRELVPRYYLRQKHDGVVLY